MVKEIGVSAAVRAVSHFPGWVLRRLLRRWYTPEKVSDQVILELRGGAPGGVILCSSVPHIELWVQITNLSDFAAEIERVQFDVWAGQPVVRGYELEPVKIGPRSRLQTPIKWEHELTELQIQYLKSQDHGGRVSQVQVYVTAQLDTKLGRTTIRRTFLCNDFLLRGNTVKMSAA